MQFAAAGMAAVALIAAGCGGDDGGGSSDEDQITEVLEAVAADPTTICDHFSPAMVESLGGAEGCQDAAAAQDAQGGEVEINEITVDGETATADVTQQDGDSTVTLSKVDGDWKIDESS